MSLRQRCQEALDRCKGATPGPWIREMAQDGEKLPDGTGYAGDWYETNYVVRAPGPDNAEEPTADCYTGDDAVFVAAARTDVEDFAAALLRIFSPGFASCLEGVLLDCGVTVAQSEAGAAAVMRAIEQTAEGTQTGESR